MIPKHPSKSRIERAVRGAVKNAADAHPKWDIDPRFKTSIAKRASGTLTAEWPEVLAARLARRQERRSRCILDENPRRGGQAAPMAASSLKKVWRRISAEVGNVRNNADKKASLIFALKIVAAAQRGADVWDVRP